MRRPICSRYFVSTRDQNRQLQLHIAEQNHRRFKVDFTPSEGARFARTPSVGQGRKQGILSSSIEGRRIFEQVLADLRAADGSPDAYDLFAVALDKAGHAVLRRTSRHQDFIVRSEDFGVPQARHRVIIVGVRRDIAAKISSANDSAGGSANEDATVRHVIDSFPILRSGLSSGDDSGIAWRGVVIDLMDLVISTLEQLGETASDILSSAQEARAMFMAANSVPPRSSVEAAPLPPGCPGPLAEWLEDRRLEVTLNHSTRGHMTEDLGRYFFSAVFTYARGRAPKSDDFPKPLAPAHANWASGKFADRFRTQRWDQPSTTVTSHISKDGHYFIHPDPTQCRSLTVREAARLQTFPDNYLFLGNRTEQYVQVGNAVPPYLARQIAAALWIALASSGADVTAWAANSPGRSPITWSALDPRRS